MNVRACVQINDKKLLSLALKLETSILTLQISEKPDDLNCFHQLQQLAELGHLPEPFEVVQFKVKEEHTIVYENLSVSFKK